MGEDVLVPMSIFGSFTWVVWIIATNIRRSKATRVAAELHAKLLDKCAASQELLGYLESEAGRRFLESASVGGTNPPARILNALQSGVILALVGMAFLMVRSSVSRIESQELFLVFGAFALAIGFGFLISAAVSYALCKSWGLLERGSNRP